jgi:hypothetical protein
MKLRRMHASPAPTQLHRMLQVKHLVVNNVFDDVARNQELIKDAADHDRIMCRIVMAEDAAGLARAPAHAWATQQSVEKTAVQILENHIEIVDPALGGLKLLASTHLPHQVRFVHHLVAGNIFTVTSRLATVDGFTVHLRQQNVGDSSDHRLRRTFQQIGEPDQKPAFAQADRVINIGEGKKLDLQLRRRSAGTQLAMCFMEDFEQSLTHNKLRLARTHSTHVDSPKLNRPNHSLRPAAGGLRIRLLSVLRGFFLLGQQFAMLVRRSIDRIAGCSQRELVLLGFLARNICRIP